VFVVFLAIIAAAPLVSGQSYGPYQPPQSKDSDGHSQPAWGASDPILLALDSQHFRPYDAADAPLIEGSATLRYCTGTCELIQPLVLPTGALVTDLQLDAYDDDASGSAVCYIYACQIQSGGCSEVGFVGTTAPDVGGAILVDQMLDPPFTVVNADFTYPIDCLISGGTTDTGFRALRIIYSLQVSPAPGVATFGDVPPVHWAFQFIEALAASGITAGCGGGNYCPDGNVTRAEMAVFLSAALGLHWPG
jgi:hypothetical protein